MKNLVKILFTCAVLCAITLSFAAESASQPTQIQKTSRVWNLQDADILSVINEVSLETGKNFIVDPKVSGKITLISSKPIKSSEVYNLFLSILEMLGYSAIQNGNVVKIVPNLESGEHATKVATSRFPGKGDEVVVRIFPLDNVSATQLIPVIRPFLPQWSNVSTYNPGNALIIFGRAANLERIEKIIHDLDHTSGNEIDIVPLRQTSASQLAIVLNNLQNAARSTGEPPQVSIAPDERSNSILLSGNKNARLKMRLLIAELDKPNARGQGNTEVIYLKYLKAKDFAPILGKIAQNITTKDASSSTPSYSPPAPGMATGKANETPQNTTNIQAEPNTNALIITAPPRLMITLRSIVAKLDIRPAQVHIEAIIVELNQDDIKNLGIQWGTISMNGDFSEAMSKSGFLPLGLGNIGIIPSQQVTAVLGMLQNIHGADILSTPSIVVLDNQKASLSVGTQVPEQTGSYATTGNTSTVNPFNTIGRLNVVLKLEVTPQINLGNSVRLNILLKNDSLKNPQNPGLNPIINTSEIKNSVLIKNQDILVLGGLISNNITESMEKVPILGDIPLLGLLFQHDVRSFEKKNLIVFIKPTIIHNPDEALSITHNKYNEAREKQIKWPEPLKSRGQQKLENILPPFGSDIYLPKPFEE